MNSIKPSRHALLQVGVQELLCLISASCTFLIKMLNTIKILHAVNKNQKALLHNALLKRCLPSLASNVSPAKTLLKRTNFDFLVIYNSYSPTLKHIHY